MDFGHKRKEIVYIKKELLQPLAGNPRKIIDKNAKAKLQSQIKKHDFQNPLNVFLETNGKYSIVCGNHRFDAGKDLMDEFPCIVYEGTKKDALARAIADNKTSEWTEFDLPLLQEMMEEFQEDSFDMEKTAFSQDELDALFDFEEDKKGLTDGDSIPENVEPVCKLGDLWILGEHKLLCGDSTKTEAVESLMGGVKADMVFTDPPYNTGMTAQSQKSGNGGTLWKGKSSNGSARLSHMFNDSYTEEDWHRFMSDFCKRYEENLKADSFLYICLDWRRSHELVPYLKTNWKFSNLIIWDKEVHGLGSDYKYTHEFIHVCKKGKPPLAKNKNGEREYQDIWHIQRKMGRDEDHATKKPIEICERAIRHGSSKSSVVLDLFGGTGSTLIACEKSNRVCYIAEIDPKYCDLILKRGEDYTGDKAVLAQ